ncbi:urea amidolyase associated protein UAAP1 [Gorillibacterium sp. sgz5001074]|uniref:urea amidolyase associated protein UAAP1 n=1 Tax=Gorillibacterium sp. sgz5001074 TaxID=3446695 RepID=UPI003F670F7C
MDRTWSKVLGAGGKWSGRIGKGMLVRFTAMEPGANAAVLLYHAEDLTERYNMPDTLKAQHTSRLTRGNVLMSDNGRVLAGIVQDSLGWHDPVCGVTTRRSTDAKYGATTYQEQRNERLNSGLENLTVELVRNGLGPRDMMPVVNLFSKVVCGEDGTMRFVEEHCPAGATVTLRTEMEVLLVVSNTPNPLDPRTPYPSVPVRIEVFPAEPLAEDDLCVHHRPENRRAYENTWDYYALKGRS